ncbi:MAG: ABC transporter ATP-binding protein, partial [Pseudomonadales bacterium]
VVPQEIVFDPFFTVREALNLQLGYMGLKERQHRDWIEELLHTLGLNDKANSKTGTLSGGMKRRVLIAQALVHRPPVVVLDEPTAGVDVELRKSLWSFAKRLNSDGHTIVLTTHYLEEAEALCDRIAIIDRGKLRALETKTEMLLRHTYSFLTVKTIGEAVPPSQLRDKLVSSSSGELRFKIDKQHDAIIGLLDQLKVAGIEVEDIETRNPGLEDVFVELTGAIDIDE